jgi:IS30 family transposase
MGQGNLTTGKRRWKQLSEKERYKIEAHLDARRSPREIAKLMGRDRRTIEREISRGSVMQRRENPYASRNPKVPDYLDERKYRADAGQRVSEANASNKGRPHKIGRDHKLARHIERKIVEEKYSPDAVIGEIMANGLKFDVTLCAKTVYNMIDSGFFLGLSNADLPVKKQGAGRQYRRVRKVALNNTKGRSIEERPSEVESREEYGHWEMDCVVGPGKPCLLVLTERSKREHIVIKMSAKTQANVKAAMDRLERKYGKRFREKFKSVTMDNGSEFLDMEAIEMSSLYPGRKRTMCYYAHPYSAWERGSNENGNRLIRRLIPKGTDIGKLSAGDVKRVERWINNYPRRMFGYKSSRQMAA